MDHHGGKYDKFGKYINGPDFNKDLGMYNDDIKNTCFNEIELKKEIKEKEELEFEKIKKEALESKKLIKQYSKPYECTSSNDEYENYEDEDINQNEIIEEQLREEEEKYDYINHLVDNVYYNNKINLNNENKENKNKIINKNEIEEKKEKEEKEEKTNKINKVNNKRKKKKTITEELINKENDFSDIENQIYIRNILDKYSLCQSDKEEAINFINELFMKYQN